MLCTINSRPVMCMEVKSGRAMSTARPMGVIPNCTPAPHDKDWIEERGIRRQSTTELYLLAMENYTNGVYTGNYPLWSKFWDEVKIQHGIGSAVYPGMA